MDLGLKGGSIDFAEKGGTVFEGAIMGFAGAGEGVESVLGGAGEASDFGPADWAHAVAAGPACRKKKTETINVRARKAIL